MPKDPYAVLRALLRAEARRSAPPKPEEKEEPQRRSGERDR
ncbi:hypothetical protein A6P39_022380 [Streptomyces sp. FXJ1.172]|nr:hypothetical protein [Streptomyces sp. FXJ1.172]WEO96553.1 hypothetical protein A6P39_022380 [Streptomyces sp. FXJ1.172]